jgi:hypothetical protein
MERAGAEKMTEKMIWQKTEREETREAEDRTGREKRSRGQKGKR